MTFTPAELDYLRSQPLGRLATVDVDGVPQVNPVGFRITSSGDVLIGGLALAKTRKYRNVAATGRAALVIDDSRRAIRGPCEGSRSGVGPRPRRATRRRCRARPTT
jgi:PPOX class F420-dependent enzyme/OxyR family protein